MPSAPTVPTMVGTCRPRMQRVGTLPPLVQCEGAYYPRPGIFLQPRLRPTHQRPWKVPSDYLWWFRHVVPGFSPLPSCISGALLHSGGRNGDHVAAGAQGEGRRHHAVQAGLQNLRHAGVQVRRRGCQSPFPSPRSTPAPAPAPAADVRRPPRQGGGVACSTLSPPQLLLRPACGLK